MLSLRVSPETLWKCRNEGRLCGISYWESPDRLENSLNEIFLVENSYAPSPEKLENCRNVGRRWLSLRASPSKPWNCWNTGPFLGLNWRAVKEEISPFFALSLTGSWDKLSGNRLLDFLFGDFGRMGFTLAGFYSTKCSDRATGFSDSFLLEFGRMGFTYGGFDSTWCSDRATGFSIVDALAKF